MILHGLGGEQLSAQHAENSARCPPHPSAPLTLDNGELCAMDSAPRGKLSAMPLSLSLFSAPGAARVAPRALRLGGHVARARGGGGGGGGRSRAAARGVTRAGVAGWSMRGAPHCSRRWWCRSRSVTRASARASRPSRRSPSPTASSLRWRRPPHPPRPPPPRPRRVSMRACPISTG